MKVENPFDRKIQVQKLMPESIKDAAIELTDTLDLCWAAAQAVFEKRAKPEHALALLPMFMERSDAKRQQTLSRLGVQTDGAPSKSANSRAPKKPPKTK